MKKILSLIAFSVLLLMPVGSQNAFASLIGDTVHVEFVGGGSIICGGDFVVGAGVEIPDCGGGGTSIDIDGNSIWFTQNTLIPDGTVANDLTVWEFTDLDWTDDPSGIVSGVILSSTNLVPLDIVFDDHSITVTAESTATLDCGGPPQCIPEWHIDITHSSTAITCGAKTFLNSDNQCVPDLNQICGSGTIPNFPAVMCFAQSMSSMIGGTLGDINTVSLLVGAIGINPVITGLVGITLAGVAAQAVWFVHRRKKGPK